MTTTRPCKSRRLLLLQRGFESHPPAAYALLGARPPALSAPSRLPLPSPSLGSFPPSPILTLTRDAAAIYAAPGRGENDERQPATLPEAARSQPVLACFSVATPSDPSLPRFSLPFARAQGRKKERILFPSRGMAASRARLSRAAAVLGFLLLAASAEAGPAEVEMVFLKNAVAKGAGACSLLPLSALQLLFPVVHWLTL